MVLECTCDMIKGDFQSYPDHRVKLYDLLKAINAHCFQALFYLPEAQAEYGGVTYEVDPKMGCLRKMAAIANG